MVWGWEGKSRNEVWHVYSSIATECLKNFDFQTFLNLCVDFEIEVVGNDSLRLTPQYDTHLLLLLLLDQLENARFLWQRTPKQFKAANPQAQVSSFFSLHSFLFLFYFFSLSSLSLSPFLTLTSSSSRSFGQ
jgi:hypothetical protein